MLYKISEYDGIATLINSQNANDRLFRTRTMELRSRVLYNEYFDKVAGGIMDDGYVQL